MTINIGSRREVLWDDFLVDTELSTVTRVVQHPIRRERVLDYDMPWEGDGCDFQNIVKIGDIWRMYYLAWKMMNEDMTMHTQGEIYVCCIDSRDGLHWERPVVGACEFNGSKDNNILLDKSFCGGFDNFYVFKDLNPSCPPEELYKATYAVWIHHPDGSVTRLLECACSADGLHFVKKGLITDKGKFDSLNICHYNPHTGKYMLFLRDFHEFPEGIDEKDGKIADLNEGIRDVRMIESDGFQVLVGARHAGFWGCGRLSALYKRRPAVLPCRPCHGGFPKPLCGAQGLVIEFRTPVRRRNAKKTHRDPSALRISPRQTVYSCARATARPGTVPTKRSCARAKKTNGTGSTATATRPLA